MGNVLDNPITEKQNESGYGNGLVYGVGGMQGWRREMEDAHVSKIGMPGRDDFSLFAVFDGHGGSTVSAYCSEKLASTIADTPQYLEASSPRELAGVMYQSVLRLDKAVRTNIFRFSERSGCTANIALITPNNIVVANAGDSRAVLCRGGAAVAMSDDHKPNNKGERRRIKRAGGTVTMQRVNGELAVSRAMGDFAFKLRRDLPPEAQQVSAAPDVRVCPRSSADEFLVIACDGVWDVITNDEVVIIIRQLLAKWPNDVTLVVNALLDLCLERGSRDNMSAVLVLLNPPQLPAVDRSNSLPNPSKAGERAPSPRRGSERVMAFATPGKGRRPGDHGAGATTVGSLLSHDPPKPSPPTWSDSPMAHSVNSPAPSLASTTATRLPPTPTRAAIQVEAAGDCVLQYDATSCTLKSAEEMRRASLGSPGDDEMSPLLSGMPMMSGMPRVVGSEPGPPPGSRLNQRRPIVTPRNGGDMGQAAGGGGMSPRPRPPRQSSAKSKPRHINVPDSNLLVAPMSNFKSPGGFRNGQNVDLGATLRSHNGSLATPLPLPSPAPLLSVHGDAAGLMPPASPGRRKLGVNGTAAAGSAAAGGNRPSLALEGAMSLYSVQNGPRAVHLRAKFQIEDPSPVPKPRVGSAARRAAPRQLAKLPAADRQRALAATMAPAPPLEATAKPMYGRY